MGREESVGELDLLPLGCRLSYSHAMAETSLPMYFKRCLPVRARKWPQSRLPGVLSNPVFLLLYLPGFVAPQTSLVRGYSRLGSHTFILLVNCSQKSFSRASSPVNLLNGISFLSLAVPLQCGGEALQNLPGHPQPCPHLLSCLSLPCAPSPSTGALISASF